MQLLVHTLLFLSISPALAVAQLHCSVAVLRGRPPAPPHLAQSTTLSTSSVVRRRQLSSSELENIRCCRGHEVAGNFGWYPLGIFLASLGYSCVQYDLLLWPTPVSL